MSKVSKHRVLIAGVTAPLTAVILYAIVYNILTLTSMDKEKDWFFRLSVSALAVTSNFSD